MQLGYLFPGLYPADSEDHQGEHVCSDDDDAESSQRVSTDSEQDEHPEPNGADGCEDPGEPVLSDPGPDAAVAKTSFERRALVGFVYYRESLVHASLHSEVDSDAEDRDSCEYQLKHFLPLSSAYAVSSVVSRVFGFPK